MFKSFIESFGGQFGRETFNCSLTNCQAVADKLSVETKAKLSEMIYFKGIELFVIAQSAVESAFADSDQIGGALAVAVGEI